VTGARGLPHILAAPGEAGVADADRALVGRTNVRCPGPAFPWPNSQQTSAHRTGHVPDVLPLTPTEPLLRYELLPDIVVVLAVSVLAFYAVRRSDPNRVKLTTSLLKLASFSIEVESHGERRAGELPPN
jgi:hypothetical protein